MLRNYSYAATGQLVSVALAVVALAIVTRSLGPANYGSYIILTAIVTLLATFAGAGPQAAALIISSREPDRRGELHGQILVATSALLVVTGSAALALAQPLARFVAPTLAPELAAVNLLRLPPLVYASLVTSQLSGAGRVGLAASLAVISAVVAMLGPVGAIISDDPLAGAVVGTVLAGYLTAVISWVFATGALGLRRPGDFAAWRSALSIAVPMHVGTIAYSMMLRLDLLVVNAILGRHDAGIYGLALGVSQRVGMLTTPLYNATAWRVSGPDRDAALRTMLQVTRLETTFGIVAALGGILLGPVLVQVVAGDDYSAASGPLAILIVGAAALPVWAAVGLYLVAHLGGAWTTARLQVLVALSSLVGYVVMTRIAGTVGAAVVSTGAYLVLLACGLTLIRRSDTFPWRALIPTPEVARLRSVLRRAPRTPLQNGGAPDQPIDPPAP
jgi:O-antigen/teichoic acid export membrane protein